jgi:hypothetical protein
LKYKLIGLVLISLLPFTPVAKAQDLALQEVVPITVYISAVDIWAPIVELELGEFGELALPDIGGVAGWLGGSPNPSRVGPTVIAGRLDWRGTEGAFWNLDRVRVGDEIVVRSVSKLAHHIAIFQITAVNLYRKTEFPTELIYGDLTYNALRLLTDGGFNVNSGLYEGNVVVFARISSETILY